MSFRAELYAEDASFTDSIKGIEVSGAEDIGSVRARRFGTGGPIAIEVIDVYAQTNGYERPTDSTIDRGDVISISISYRAQAGSEDPSPTEALVTFELGKRRPDGFDLHPESLITREEVFHATNG